MGGKGWMYTLVREDHGKERVNVNTLVREDHGKERVNVINTKVREDPGEGKG